MTECFSMIRGRALRATRLDECGAPYEEEEAYAIATDGFISVELVAETEEADEWSISNQNGDVLIADQSAPTILGYQVAVHLCGVNPDLISLLTGQPVVLDGNDISVGFRANTEVEAVNFALELWSDVPAALCVDGQKTYGYLLLPYITSGTVGDFSVENAAVNFSITGGRTKVGSKWGRGPYYVTIGGDGNLSQLATPIDPEDHLHVQMTRVAPPDPSCHPILAGMGFGLGGFGLTPFGG